MPDFIGVYDNAINSKSCKQIIDWFEENKTRQFRGRYWYNDEVKYDKTIKDSTDIEMNLNERDLLPNFMLSQVLEWYSIRYFETYRSVWIIDRFFTDCGYNLQRYYPGQGYPCKHCENSCSGNNRVMAWTIYLNTVEDGGTYYNEYDKTIDAVEGRLVIFPAFWTHTHQGIISNTKTKYIATGWYIYE